MVKCFGLIPLQKKSFRFIRLQLFIVHMHIHPTLNDFPLFPSALVVINFQFYQTASPLRTRIMFVFECQFTGACTE